MTSTPLAMQNHGFQFGETASVIQWHVLAMFVPSFFTGYLIERFGALRIIMSGALLQLGCVLVNLQGQEQWNFVAGLMLLGIGWNFLFLGGTTLLTTSYSGAEKAVAQGLNDFLVFAMVTMTALGSGALHHAFGWNAINLVMVPFVVLAFGLGLWLHRQTMSNAKARTCRTSASCGACCTCSSFWSTFFRLCGYRYRDYPRHCMLFWR
jgi:MFS family permease